MKLLYRIIHTFPNGGKSTFLVERECWHRWEAWRDELEKRLDQGKP